MPTNQEQYDEIKDHIALLKETQSKLSMSDGAQVDGVIIKLNDELIALDRELLNSRNANYVALTSSIRSAKSEFDALDQEIKDIIKAAETVTKVFDGLTKLTGYLARVAV